MNLLGIATTFLRATSVQQTPVRYIRNKHRNVKWRNLRAKKVLPVELPDYEELRRETKGQLTPEEIRAMMKKEGMFPSRPYNERPILLTTTDTILEPFIPPEGDGKLSTLTKDGVKQRYELLEKKGKTMLNLRKLRRFEEEFDSGDFAMKAQDIYIEAHNTLVKGDYEKLHDLVTELAFPDMLDGTNNKTMRWKWVESIEMPRLVHVRVAPILTKTNLYGQITVRIHGRQLLSVYDRFGRLMYGSEDLVKNVLEYVVFEKHLANPYGAWRLHGKIVPSWAPPRDAVLKTFKKPILETPSEEFLKRKQERQKIKDDEELDKENIDPRVEVPPPPPSSETKQQAPA
ncbi:putative 39S ribosomal protein L45, mitochondrial [Hypsibius exemplaris]|uniref:Large ribosomal subunit protein mL45 n=1 Tax=Hypsibius exemplaris TaxID=2072580 RepID=A0A9X6NDT9_HYPEX|nr:putative 39S ribosomal protein L45, mitochondrial [Hypsibius exemplaris]